MYKVLVVEDEDIIRKGLIYTFDWITADCTVVGEAENGLAGRDMILELSPDIVITDVTMPLMDGLEMLESTVGQRMYSAIIISGYDEFSLAQRAIKMGVTEYLLKPLEEHELLSALDRAKVVLEQKKLYNSISDKAVFSEADILERVPTQSITSKKVRAMLEYIENNYSKKISIHDLTGPLNASSTYLNQKFKADTSYTFNDFLNRYRVQQAIGKIKSEGGKIYNIASEVGFKDYKYFISVFKKYADLPPGKFAEYFEKSQG